MESDAVKAQLDLEEFISGCPSLVKGSEGTPCSVSMLSYLYNQSLKEQGRSDFLSMVSIAMLAGEKYALSLKANDKGKQCFQRLRLTPQKKEGNFVKPSERLKAYYGKLAGEPDNGTRVGGRKAMRFYDFAQGYNESSPDHRLTFRYIKQKMEEAEAIAKANGEDWVVF